MEPERSVMPCPFCFTVIKGSGTKAGQADEFEDGGRLIVSDFS